MIKDPHLRFISVTALILSPDKTKFLLCKRSEEDEFKPGALTLPSGRVEGTELVKHRLLYEIEEETEIPVDKNSITYIDECTFRREDYDVNQLCFSVVATTEKIMEESEELGLMFWITPQDFVDQYDPEDYAKHIFNFVKNAIKKNLFK